MEQYLLFLQQALEGNLGRSFAHGEPAMALILERLPATLELAISATVIAIVLGIPLGLWAGLRPRTQGFVQGLLGWIIERDRRNRL